MTHGDDDDGEVLPNGSPILDDEDAVSVDETDETEDEDGGAGEALDDADDEDDEDAAGLEPEPEPQPNSRQRRSQTRWQKTQEELAATRKRAEEAEARAKALEVQQQREATERQQTLDQQRAARREMMTPEERLNDEVQELRAQMRYNREMDEFQRQDAADKANFDAMVRTNKVYARHQEAVERNLKDIRARGTNLSRDAILRYLIGDEALKQATPKPATPKATRKVVSKPTNSRGDGASTQSSRGSSSAKEQLRKRLENIPL